MASPKAIASASSSPVAAGAFLQGDGTAVANGYVMLELTVPTASLTGGGEVSRLPAKKISLDVNGVPSAAQTLFASDQFASPVNPAYRVRVHNANDLMIGDLGNCVISGAAPIDLTTLVSTASGGVSFPAPLLVAPSGASQNTTGTLWPTTNAAYGLGKTSFGWKDIIAAGTPWVDVRAYGAVGDDVTDDTVAIQNAINATPHSGTLYIPPLSFLVSRQGANAQCLLVPYPMRIVGSGMGTELFGSVLRVASTVPNTVDVIRLLADANGSDGYVLQDFAIQSNTQAARSAINIDTTSFPIARLTITRVGLYGAFNSFGIRTTNPTPLTNGFFVSDIGPGNIIRNGILLQNAGDSLRIWNNDIPFGNVVTSNAGIDATYVPGAQQTTISGNNITQTKGGGIHLGSAARNTYIFDNFFEGGQSGTDVGSNGALIDLDGVTGNHILHADIHDNIIQSITTNIDNIRVNFADSAFIYGNTITRPGGTAVDVRVTANASNTMIGWNRWEPTGDTITNILADSGTQTQYELYGFQSPSGFTFGNRIYVPNGANGSPSYSFASATTSGRYWHAGAGAMVDSVATVDVDLLAGNRHQIGSGMGYTFASNANPTAAGNDTGIGRLAAGILSVDTSTIGNTAGIIKNGNLVRVASNFTTANNANLQAITGLSWTLPAVAGNYSFHAKLTYSIATAVVAVAFGIQVVTNAPTNVFANGTQQITVGPPATFTTGTLATLTTTTATAIVTGTPGATATNYVVELDGTIELPASANTIQLMVSTAAGADAVTVLRGSFAYLY